MVDVRTQRRSAQVATVTLPLAGSPATESLISGALFDADTPRATSGENSLLVRQAGVINLPGLLTIGPDHRIALCGQDWEVVGEAAHWLDRTKVRVQEAKPPLHCAIRRPGADKGDFDETTGTYPSTPHDAYFTGVARTQQATAEARSLVVGSDDVTTLAYTVHIIGDLSGVRVEDVVTLAELDADGDPTGDPVELVVKAFNRSDLVWEFDLICTDKF